MSAKPNAPLNPKKGCPFCVNTLSSTLICSEQIDGMWSIQCHRCQATGPEEYSEEEAWITWNTRAAVGVEEEKKDA